MKKILRSLVLIFTLVVSVFIFNTESHANKLEHDFNILIKDDKDQNKILLKDKDDTIVYNSIVYTKIDKNLLEEGENKDLEEYWYIPTNDYIERYNLEKYEDFDKSKENEIAYKLNSKEKFEFKIKKDAILENQNHQYFDEYYQIDQTYKLKDKEYKISHKVLFENNFLKTRKEKLNRINPDLLLNLVNKRDNHTESKKDNNTKTSKSTDKKTDEQKSEEEKSDDEEDDEDNSDDYQVNEIIEVNKKDAARIDSSNFNNWSLDPNRKVVYSGTLNSKDSTPLSNKEIRLVDSLGNSIKTTTDEDGYFKLKLDQNSNYSIFYDGGKGKVQTGQINEISIDSDDIKFSPGKTLDNKYGYINFNPSVAYLNHSFANYKVKANQVIINNDEEFNYERGDIIALPPNTYHASGKLVRIDNIEKKDGKIVLSFINPTFTDTFREVKMDTGDEGIDISEFSFVENDYYKKIESYRPRMATYSVHLEDNIRNELLISLENNLRFKADQEKNDVIVSSMFKHSFKFNDYGYAMEFNLSTDSEEEDVSITDYPSGLELKFSEDDDINDFSKAIKKGLEEKKFKKYRTKDFDFSSEITTSVENTFSLSGNLGMKIDYSIFNPAKTRIELKNNFVTKNALNFGLKSNLNYETPKLRLQSPYLIGVDLSFVVDGEGELKLVSEYDVASETTTKLENGKINSEKLVEKGPLNDTSVEGEAKLEIGPKLTPYLGIEDIKLLSTDFLAYLEGSLEFDNKESYGEVNGVLKWDKVELGSSLLKVELTKEDGIYKKSFPLWSNKKIAKEVNDKDIIDNKNPDDPNISPNTKYLDINYKIGGPNTTVLPSLHTEFEAKNPGTKIIKNNNGVFMYIQPELATKMKTYHKSMHYSDLFNEVYNCDDLYVNYDNYYKDIVINRNKLLNGYESIDKALQRAGMKNETNKPNPDVYTEVEFFNIPKSLSSINDGQIFYPKARISDFDQGEYEVYVVRKEIRKDKSGLDYYNKRRPNETLRPSNDFTYTDYYLDKFKLKIGDEKVKEAKEIDNTKKIETYDINIEDSNNVENKEANNNENIELPIENESENVENTNNVDNNAQINSVNESEEANLEENKN